MNAKHRLKRRELVRDIFFIFSEEYEKSDVDTIWDIKLPMSTLMTYLRERYNANYTSSNWIKMQIKRYEREIGGKLFNFIKEGMSEQTSDKDTIAINREMNAFHQHNHLYVTYKIKLANGLYGIIQNYISTNKPSRPINLLLGSGTNPYFLANIIAEKSRTRKEKYNIYTHNVMIIRKLCNSRVNHERIKFFSPAGRINPYKHTIMGPDNALYRSIDFDFIIQSTQFLYNGNLYVDTEEEAIRKHDILENCRGTKVLALVKDELIEKEKPGMAFYGPLTSYDYIVIPRTHSDKKHRYDILFDSYKDQLDTEIINWNYIIYRIRKEHH